MWAPPRPQNDPAKNVEWRSKCTEIGQEGFDISSVESKSRQEKRALKSSTLLSLKAREIWVKEAWPSYLATSLPHSHTLLSWKELSPAESTDFNNKYGAQNRKPDTERPYATKTARLRVQSQEKTYQTREKTEIGMAFILLLLIRVSSLSYTTQLQHFIIIGYYLYLHYWLIHYTMITTPRNSSQWGL